MKLFLLILISAALAPALNAQTNPASPAIHDTPITLIAPPTGTETNSPAQTNAAPRAPTEIFSDSGEFDLKTRVAVYAGNVRVNDPQMKLFCELLTVIVPDGGGRINHIVAETNVVIEAVDNQGNPVHATSQKAVYTYKVENSVTNELIELTGEPMPHVDSKTVSGSGEKIIWDRTRNSIRVFHQQRMTIQQGEPKAAGTNPPPAGENKIESKD